MVLGRRPLAVLGVLPAAPQPPNRTAQKYEFCRPTDIGWDPQGNTSSPMATATIAS